jgi:hypothetical protein
MKVRDKGKGGRWYVIAVHYPTALMAKRAWERCQSKLNLASGDEGIGVVRMSPRHATPDPSMDIGNLPDDVHSVVAITLHEPTAHKCERLVRDGTPWTPSDAFADTLIYRRVKVVMETQRRQPGSKGRLVIRRPESCGAQMDALGNVYEQTGGDE